MEPNEDILKQKDCKNCNNDVRLYLLKLLSREVDIMIDKLDIEMKLKEEWQPIKDTFGLFSARVSSLVGNIGIVIEDDSKVVTMDDESVVNSKWEKVGYNR